MNAKVSNYLDIVRVLASFAVLFQHLSMFNNDVFSFFQGWGHQAVIAFFLLSGYVIAYVAKEREQEFKIYMGHRLSRIYSVMIVAWVLTIALDSIGALISPSTYEGAVVTDLLAIRVLSHFFFLNELWFFSIQFFGNQPLWSLAYEFSYYVLFGFATLYKGRYKTAIVLGFAVLVGPVILAYGCIWLAGVYLYRLHSSGFSPSRALSSLLFILTAVVIALFPSWEHMVEFSIIDYKKFESAVLIKDYVFSFFIFLNILFFKYSSFSMLEVKSIAKFFSSISFSLYVFHYPLIYFFGALIREHLSISTEVTFCLQTILIVFAVYLLSYISERRKSEYFRLYICILENRRSDTA